MCDDEDYDDCSDVSFVPWDDDGYDLFRELAEKAPSVTMEHALDTAMRTNNVPLRCYYEEHGEKAAKELFPHLHPSALAEYDRLPVVRGSGLPSGTFFVRSYEGEVREIPPVEAQQHPMYAFQAS